LKNQPDHDEQKDQARDKDADKLEDVKILPKQFRVMLAEQQQLKLFRLTGLHGGYQTIHLAGMPSKPGFASVLLRNLA
jgi:hypothetical protein